MNNGGRPKITIDWKQFEAYCAIQCTLREIADYFNCSEMTIERKVKEQYGCCFVDVFKRKRQKGLMSLRANLFKLSEKQGNVAIFLAKNWLGLSDKQEIEHSGNIGKRAEELSDEELTNIIAGRRSRRVTEETEGS